MTYFYVAGTVRYTLVKANNEAEAQSIGIEALKEVYDDFLQDFRTQHGYDYPLEIVTLREATAAEIELWEFHQEMMAA